MINTLNYEDYFTDGKFKSINTFHQEGLPLTPVIWMRLQCALYYTGKIHKKEVGADEEGQSVRQFLGRIKKGSKKISGNNR